MNRKLISDAKKIVKRIDAISNIQKELKKLESYGYVISEEHKDYYDKDVLTILEEAIKEVQEIESKSNKKFEEVRKVLNSNLEKIQK